MTNKIFSVADVRSLAKRRMPKIIFDYVDGAAGNEYACELNSRLLDCVRMLPSVLVNVDDRKLGNPMKLLICNLAGTYPAVFDTKVNSSAGRSTRWLHQSDFF